MSKKGIFSIASGGNKDSSTPEATDEGAADSPFARDDNEAQEEVLMSLLKWTVLAAV